MYDELSTYQVNEHIDDGSTSREEERRKSSHRAGQQRYIAGQRSPNARSYCAQRAHISLDPSYDAGVVEHT